VQEVVVQAAEGVEVVVAAVGVVLVVGSAAGLVGALPGVWAASPIASAPKG